MRATSEAVEGNKVRLSVEVDESEVDKVLDEAVRTLARQARVPGFRPGRVPRQILEARMGGAVALRAEALKEAIPDFYAQALSEVEIDPISQPEFDITAGKETGALAFDALVEVRPVVAIPGYAGLRVSVPSPEVTEEEVDAQVDRLRETEAELVEVSRPARDGDNVTIDLHGTAAGDEVVASDDVLYEIGSGRLVEGLDEQLRGGKTGDILTFAATLPDGREVAFRVLVKDVKEKRLPDPTDEWAAEASEFATLGELRDDLRSRIGRVKAVQAQLSLRNGAMAALVELVDDAEVPDALVEGELRERLHDLGHRLEQQGIGLATFLEATGRTQEQLVEELQVDARQAVKGDLALRALADAEALETTDDEIATEIEAMAARLQLEPDVVRERLTRAGRMAAVRSEQRKAKALTWLLDHVELVDEEGRPVSRDDLRMDQSAEDQSAEEEGIDDAGAAARRSGDGEVEDSSEQAMASVSGAEGTDGEVEG
jgi:trigger factor